MSGLIKTMSDGSTSKQLPSFPASPVCLCDGGCCHEERVEIKYHVINSRIPPPLPPPALPSLIFVCRAKRTSVHLPLRRIAEHPPLLKIGCSERGLRIDSINYSLYEIFISHSHLQTPLTITRVLQHIPTSMISSERFPQSALHVLNSF